MIDETTLIKAWDQLNAIPVSHVKNPQAFILGGQPGAGKSESARRILDRLGGNALFINGDDFRKLHPEYKRIQKEYGANASEHTGSFAGEVVERIIDLCVNKRVNVIVEGTFRTTETPIKTLKKFKDAGYKTHVLIQTCDKKLSWKSCIERYEEGKRVDPQNARMTPKEHHDLVVKNLPKNIKSVWSSGLADSLEIYWREPDGEQRLLCAINHGERIPSSVIKKISMPAVTASPER